MILKNSNVLSWEATSGTVKCFDDSSFAWTGFLDSRIIWRNWSKRLGASIEMAYEMDKSMPNRTACSGWTLGLQGGCYFVTRER